MGASTTPVLVVASVAFNLGGAWSDRALEWNSDVPLTISPLWSWSDPQFLGGLPFAPHAYYAQLLALVALTGVATCVVVGLRDDEDKASDRRRGAATPPAIE